MKKMPLLAVFFMLLLQSTLCFAGGNVTGFWLDAKAVEKLAEEGASTLKIYAGMDGNGNLCYLMTGGDARFTTIGGEVYMQNSKGVCPPQCDITSAEVGGRNASAVSSSQASDYINNYMRAYEGTANCARFTMSSLEKLRTTAAYIQVTLGTKSTTASGYDEDGAAMERSNVSGSSATTGL